MCLPPLIRAVVRAESRSGFVAECDDIPVQAEGATREEVVKKLRAAIQAYLERDENPFADYVLITEEAESA
jgi:predicted RNase H-like HicB family nuclease